MPSKKTSALAVVAIVVLSVALVAFYVEASMRQKADLSRVALVGDSITAITSYPSSLQTMLGDGSVVGNFGVSGTTVNLASIQPYLFENASKEARAFNATVVVILLGTNDARLDVYPYIDRFSDDYRRIIGKFENLTSKPQIYLVIPPPVYQNNINISDTDLTVGVIPKIEAIAKETGLPIIDCYTPLLNHPDYFVDGVHPNHDGAKVIADAVYKALTAPLP